jgi:hypothetical protein
MEQTNGDGVWIRDKIIEIERELGGYAERHRALEQSDSLIRAEVREGFSRQERMISDGLSKLSTDIATSHAHMRGELERVVREIAEHRRVEEQRQVQHARTTEENHRSLVTELRRDVSAAKAEADAVLVQNRRIMALVAIAVVFGNFVIEHLDDFLALAR